MILMDAEFVEFLRKETPQIRKIAKTLRCYSSRRFPSLDKSDKKEIVDSCFMVAESFEQLLQDAKNL
jgi:hypothetical protein